MVSESVPLPLQHVSVSAQGRETCGMRLGTLLNLTRAYLHSNPMRALPKYRSKELPESDLQSLVRSFFVYRTSPALLPACSPPPRTRYFVRVFVGHNRFVPFQSKYVSCPWPEPCRSFFSRKKRKGGLPECVEVWTRFALP